MRLFRLNPVRFDSSPLFWRPLHVYGRFTAIVLAVLAGTLTLAASAWATFGISPGSFQAAALNRDGSVDVQAGSHPYAYKVSFAFNHDSEGNADGSARDIVLNLPPGFVGNPTAVPRCPRQDLEGSGKCPGNTQIGTFSVVFREPPGNGIAPGGPIYNLVPPHGAAASFGFTGAGFTAFENASLIHSGAGYRVSVITNNVSHGHALTVSETIWGVPADASHDPERSCVTPQEEQIEGCSTDTAPAPFATLPTSCNGPLSTLLEVDSTEAPGEYLSESALSLDAGGNPVGLLGCEALDFSPSIIVQPETSASASPTGLHVDLHVPQDESVGGLAEAHLKDAVVTLPAGVVVNPSSADGLQGCSSAQIDLGGPEPAHCPDASQIGTVQVDTPLLDHPLPGKVYLAAQGDNPFQSLLAIYIAVYDPITGVVVKLAGHVEPDPVTGQLMTTFAENPQLPFEDFKLDFFGGARAPLVTPTVCGTYTTTTDLTPWSAPFAPDAAPSSSFVIDGGCGGGGFAPSFSAGTTSNQAGAFSSFTTTFSRQDGEQALGGVRVTTPPGLLGALKSVVRCPEPQASEGACGPESLIGETTTAVGAGPDPYWVRGGRVYLTGPYNGGPFGLSIVVPAVAGPFDLGSVIVRSSIRVDPHTAQITVVSDALPRILDGIPLQIRTVNVMIDRPGFVFNPTNCERLSVNGTIASTQGAQAAVSSPFEAANCASLPFKPRLSVTTQARTSKAMGASLKFKIGSGPGQANIGKVRFVFPKQLPARLTTLQKACTEGQFNANPAGCPMGSVIGTAIAHIPVLNNPLTGPIYLVSHGGAAFPDAVLVLQGEGILLDLVGNTSIKKGITMSTFNSVPDAPISTFEAILPEGSHSAFATNISAKAKGNMCGQRLTMPNVFTGQNGAVISQRTRIGVTGCPKAKAKGKAKRHKGKAKGRKK